MKVLSMIAFDTANRKLYSKTVYIISSPEPKAHR